MKVLILRCAGCGTELNRTVPVTDGQAAKATLNSPFNAGKCPKGCRSTFRDLNINTRIDAYEAGSEPPAPPPPDDVCRCESPALPGFSSPRSGDEELT